jgi:hypothetical protein
MDTKSYTVRVPKRWARIALIVGVTALIVAPLTAVASHSFTDVPDSHTFHEDIEWMKESGVTRGCNPPANTRYCPEDDVKRSQMAAFMKRFAQYLGAEDGTPAQADHATTADSATSADDASMLAGASPTAYQTLIWGVACDTDCEGAPASATEQLRITVSPPSSGTLLVSMATDLQDPAGIARGLRGWITLDSACQDLPTSGSPSGIVKGSFAWQEWDAATGFADLSVASTTAIPIPSGSHTLRLCNDNGGFGGAGDVLSAVLTATWSSLGSVTTASSGADPVFMDTSEIVTDQGE